MMGQELALIIPVPACYVEIIFRLVNFRFIDDQFIGDTGFVKSRFEVIVSNANI